MQLRIGNGYDIHRRGGGSPLILGGGAPGSSARARMAHSDADVLRACPDRRPASVPSASDDIGLHFPPRGPALEGPTACLLLEQVSGPGGASAAGRWSMWTRWWWRSAAKLKPHIEAMRAAIARAFWV